MREKKYFKKNNLYFRYFNQLKHFYLTSMSVIIRLKETNSTNQYLQEQLTTTNLTEGTMVLSEYQTHGKGQIGNKWESDKEKNITCSLILYPTFLEISEQFIISQIISLAILDTLQKYISNLKIKWPNDIYYKNKKIAGILIENSISGKTIQNCIVGIGININQEKFSKSIPNAISLKQITEKEQDINKIAENLQKNIFVRYNEILREKNNKIHQEYQKNLFRFSEFHLYKTKGIVFEAKIKEVKTSGHLVLEEKETKKRSSFLFKEVEFVL